MDLLARARALAACPLFADLAPAAVIRLAERAHPADLAVGDRRTTDDRIWVVVSGELAIASTSVVAFDATASVTQRRGRTATPGHVLGLVRVVAPTTPPVAALAVTASRVIGLAHDDIRDVLEEDPVALAALSAALARVLVEAVT